MMTSIHDMVGCVLMFCPGDRPERFAKATQAADVAVLDLEDAVAPAGKDAARAAVEDYLRNAGADRLAVRINLPSTERGMIDAAAVAAAGARLLLLPKIESVEELDRVAGATGCELIATIETAKGLQQVERIAGHPAVSVLSWGPYDLAADMGMRAVRDPENALLPPLAYARNRLLIAAAATAKTALDTVTAELRDAAVIERDAAEGAVLGFRGKFAIHPMQVEPIRRAYRPSAGQVERARRMLAAVEGRGVFVFEGDMIDEPILRRARAIVAADERPMA
jgi:citrate lyase subunit beta/citryl-CoA lyase